MNTVNTEKLIEAAGLLAGLDGYFWSDIAGRLTKGEMDCFAALLFAAGETEQAESLRSDWEEIEDRENPDWREDELPAGPCPVARVKWACYGRGEFNQEGPAK